MRTSNRMNQPRIESNKSTSYRFKRTASQAVLLREWNKNRLSVSLLVHLLVTRYMLHPIGKILWSPRPNMHCSRSKMTILTPKLLLYFTVFLLVSRSLCHARSSTAANSNPYKVLGIGKDASQDDIRRNYRKLCLKYHPDKDVSKPTKERERCEELFKNIQRANSEIGDEPSRRKYDAVASSPFQSHNGGSGTGSTSPFEDSAAAEAFFRAFNSGSGGRHYNSNLFTRGFASQSAFAGSNQSPSSYSEYVTKVKVPLEHLYSGGKIADFEVRDTVWKRYRAAFRGGSAGPVALQALGVCFPMLLRARFPIVCIIFVGIFHTCLPRPRILRYEANLRRGWKGGTKLKFSNAEPGFNMIFVLEEEKHNRFRRTGNDLCTSISIDATQARTGCTIEIEPLSELEMPIRLELKPNQILQSGQVVTVLGKGWPQRKRDAPGDLVITVSISKQKNRRNKYVQPQSKSRR